ncbi:MAG: hypothetical protein ACLP07_17650 [Terracidiphilus sp.]
MMGAGEFDVPPRKKQEFIIEWIRKIRTLGQGSLENESPFSAISPCVGERSSQPQFWKVISL